MNRLAILLFDNPFKGLNVVEILKLGIIGLVFLMIYPCYLLLSKELSKNPIRPNAIGAIKWFMTACGIFLILCIIDGWFEKPENTQLLFGKSQIQVKQVEEITEDQVPKGYFISSELGFAFKKMDTSQWMMQPALTGIDGIARLNFPANKVDSAKTVLEKNYAQLPVYKMIANQKMFVVENIHSELNIKFTDSTTNPDIAYQLAELKNQLIAANHLDEHKPEDKKKIDDQLKSYESETILQTQQIIYKNRLIVTVFSKADLPAYLKNMSIGDFFKSFGDISKIDQLVSTPNSILVKGISYLYNKVLIDNKPGDFRADKLYLLASNAKYFYVVEIAYSPQSNTKTEVYSNLDELLNSFKLIKL